MKLIAIVIAITCWRFSVAQGGGKVSSKNGYPALEMTVDSEFKLYYPRDDIEQKLRPSDQSHQFIYFCPQQNNTPWHLMTIVSIGKPLFFIVQISSERKTVKCDKPVKPFVNQNKVIKCGENDRGSKHFLLIQLFYSTDYFKIAGWQSIDMKQYEDLSQNLSQIGDKMLTIISIYRFCFYHDTHETAFARYTINSLNLRKPQIPQNFDTRLTDNDQLTFGLDDAPLCYKKENQSFGDDFGENIGDDYLVEQMLVPQNDMTEEQERGYTKNYANVAPQWKSLREDWNSLNLFVKTHSAQALINSIKDPSKFSSYWGFDVVCGTYGKFRHIRLGKIDVDKWQPQQAQPHQLMNDPMEVEPLLGSESSSRTSHSAKASSSNEAKKSDLTLTVPLYWWKYIRRDNEGIVIIMPNYPKSLDFPSDKVESLCEDVCGLYGWAEVKAINPNIVCCRPTGVVLAKLWPSNGEDIPMSVLSLSTPNDADVTV